MESIPPAYVALLAGTSNRAVVPAFQAGNRFLGSLKGLQIQALVNMVLIDRSNFEKICFSVSERCCRAECGGGNYSQWRVSSAPAGGAQPQGQLYLPGQQYRGGHALQPDHAQHQV